MIEKHRLLAVERERELQGRAFDEREGVVDLREL